MWMLLVRVNYGPFMGDVLESWLNEAHATQPTGSASHRPKNWDNVGIELRKTELLANCNNDRDRAWILASRARHAGTWLNAFPISTCGLRMSNDVIRAAVGFRLGCRLCEPHLCRCGALVDAYGTHSLACNRNAAAGRQLCHHLINDIIYRSLARANIPSSREPLGLYRSDGRRPDGVTLTPWRAGKFLIWHATSPDTQAAFHINGTSQKAGAAAEQAANQKTDKYRELASKYFFIPIAVETLWPINADGANYLSKLGRRIDSPQWRNSRLCTFSNEFQSQWKCGFICGLLRGTGTAQTMIRSKTNWQYRTV